jgi:CheY-like chemotaxis protein
MRQILVVDDERSVRQVLRDVLTDAGYTVETAPDGRTALELIARTPPDLVMTDVMMPHLDGWALLARVRERLPVLPVIVMSAVDPRDARRHRAITADHTVFLGKPFDLETLLAIVAHLTGVPPG